MKKQSINFSWPATLSDFSVDTAQENFSRGKLKVFYIGETADHRYFPEEFAKELMKTLPYTPVVSYYDEEKEDFVGHATEQQILGIVDPCRESTIEEDEDGNQWCVCDVVLYTERPDKVGDLAKKIVGHSQSLELDPSSVKYQINYDEKKHFKNIEFTAGRFVGVSVLGNDQKPAFTGSSFFSYDSNFEEKMNMLKEYCEANQDQTQTGGAEMNLNEFMKLSWGDISCKVNDTIMKEYQNDAYTMVMDMFDNSAIVRFYYYIGEETKLMRVKYSVSENGDVVLGDVNEVRLAYEDVFTSTEPKEEIGVTQANEQNEEIANEEVVEEPEFETTETIEETTEEVSTVDEVSEMAEESMEETKEVIEEENKEVNEEFADAACEDNGSDAEPEQEAAQVVDAENVSFEEMKVSVETNEITKETSSSSTSLTESERAEFEALKRQEKVALVSSFKEDLSEEDINLFMEKVDEFDKTELELELLKAYKANSQIVKPMRVFSILPTRKQNDDTLDSFVKKNL